MAIRTIMQDFKLIPRLGDFINKIINSENQDIVTTVNASTNIKPVKSSTDQRILTTIQQSNTHPNVFSSLDIMINSIKKIDDMHPTLCDDLKFRLFPEKVLIKVSLHSHNKKKINNKTLIIDNTNIQQSIDYSKFFEVYIRNSRIKKFASLINISRTPDKLKSFFFDETLQIQYIYEQDVDIANKYDITKKENIDTITSISQQKFLALVLETYPDDDAIIKQFMLDLPRQDVYLNGQKIKKIDDLFMGLSIHNKLIYFNQSISTSRSCISIMMIALLLICQSSFYVSFLHLHNKVGKMKSIIDNDVLYINDHRHNIHVTDLKERNRIIMSISEGTFSCSFDANYRILDIMKDRILFKVQAETLFDINTDTCLIVYEAIKPELII